MPAVIKLSKAQLSKIIQSGFFGALVGKLAGPLMKVAASLAKNVFVPYSIYGICVCNRFRYSNKMCGKAVVRAGEGITLIIPNEDMEDIIRIIKSLENLSILISGVSETVEHE